MSDSTSTFVPGQRVHHRSFGPGRVSGRPLATGAVRVRFDSGLTPLVRTADLLAVPDGLEPVYLDNNAVSDYARIIRRPGFSVEEIFLMPSGERAVWITSMGEDEWISLDQARELIEVLQDLVDASED